MKVLVDTNIHLRAIQETHHESPLANRAVARLLDQGNELIIVPQVAYEFWAAGTGSIPPDGNGLGLSVGAVTNYLSDLLVSFSMLFDNEKLFRRWHRLVAEFGVVGRMAHDTRLVAAMNVHGIDNILTFNVADFANFPNITVIEPASLVP